MIVALGGGVGGARLAVGLAAVLPPRGLTIVVNTGDDFEHLGLRISPDLDSVLYTLADVNNRRTGWGRADETWSFMETLRDLGGEGWFRLGDRDVALHVQRTVQLRRGVPLSEVTARLAARLGIRHPVVPMSDMPVRTRVRTDRGELDFQDYFVKRRCAPRVRGFRFAGSGKARVPASLRRVLRSPGVRAAVFAPSNPYVSIAPILSLSEIREWLARRSFPVVAVSPIVGGAAVKGPAAKMMRELGCEASAVGLVRHYGDRVDGWVIDHADAKLARAITLEGKAVLVTDTIMASRGKSAELARKVAAFARARKTALKPGLLWTVVPVRGYARGKSRLAAVLDPGARLRLNRRLLLATLRVITRWRGDLRRCVVVSPCPRALAAARSEGAASVAEAPPRGLNAAAALGAAYARRHGARGVLVLPCDLPGLTPAALTALARGARGLRQVAIAPDRKGSGTNALLLTAPGRFEFQFGTGSFSRHELQAARHGYGVSICERAELAFDLDTPEDLAAWRKAARERPERRTPGDIVREKRGARLRRRTKDDK